MSWAQYVHLPAWGLGKRDPKRPHVTGGLGGAIFITVPGPAGEIILILPSPILEWVKALMFPDADLTKVVAVSTADLTLVTALQQVAPVLVYADSPSLSQLDAVQSVDAALYRVQGPYAPWLGAAVLDASLVGALLPETDGVLDTVGDLASLEAVLEPDLDPVLYAGKILSSQG